MAPDQVPPNNFPNTLANCAIRQYARGMTNTDHRLSDNDLTMLVERGAQGSWDSTLGPASGTMWDEIPHVTKNSYRESVLPVIFHGTKALHELGYRKPRTITTVEELDALPARSVVRSEQTTIWEKFDGTLTGVFWADTFNLGQHPSGHIALPATVLWEPEA